jgi:hypothetical protein
VIIFPCSVYNTLIVYNLGKWQHIKVAVKYLKVLQENQKKLPREKIQEIING